MAAQYVSKGQKMVSDQIHLGRPAADLFNFLTLLSKGRFQDSHDREQMINAAIQKSGELVNELRGQLKGTLGDAPTVQQQRFGIPAAEAPTPTTAAV